MAGFLGRFKTSAVREDIIEEFKIASDYIYHYSLSEYHPKTKLRKRRSNRNPRTTPWTKNRTLTGIINIDLSSVKDQTD